MKSAKRFTFILILLATSAICFGQAKPVAIEIDSFGKITCEDLTARIERLFWNLREAPDSTAYIIINGDKGNALEKYTIENGIKNILLSLRLEDFTKRVVIVHGVDNDSLMTNVWLIPPGAEMPTDSQTVKWDYSLPGITKAFKFHERFWDVGDVCPPFQDEKFYAKLLNANSEFRGNIVIYESGAGKFKKTKNSLIDDLVNKYKVSLNRLKFFHVKSSGYPGNVEFWLVPKRK